MKKTFLLILFTSSFFVFSQDKKFPVFKNCELKGLQMDKSCFYEELNTTFFLEFQTPDIILKDNFQGDVNIAFVVTNQGDFKLIHVNSPYVELKDEIERVFATIKGVKPAMYNNHAIDMRFILPISFPIYGKKEADIIAEQQAKENIYDVVDTIKKPSEINLHRSQIYIPFSHFRYIDFEHAKNKDFRAHTAVKPYTYGDVERYMDLDSIKQSYLKPNKTSYLGRKLWNEHLIDIDGKGYWITMDFLLDLQYGKDNSNEVSYTFNNTRAVAFNGGFGDKFSFSATILESQGRFASYVNDFISNLSPNFKPAFSEGLVPGRGKAKGFKEDAFDYLVAEAYLSYKPSDFINFQFGNGKNFIGDGYRSLLLSDVSSPMPFAKLNLNFWKFNYTNIWMWGRDLRNSVLIDDKLHPRKYIAAHYLSINLTKKLNIGLFEAAISKGEQGFDIGFVNPLILYRSVEFNRGEDSGNALLGLTGKYRFSDNFMMYSQFLIDEFTLGRITDSGYWGNKRGFQIGAKYFDAFQVKNLFLQAEYNTVRPYTYAHKDPILNYANYSQPLAHLWTSNFWEATGIMNYKFNRFNFASKIIYGKKGFDFDEDISYGGNVYKSYETRRGDEDNYLTQGNTATIFIADFSTRYLLNASNNLSLFGNVSFRNFDINTNTPALKSSNTVWFTVGVKADLFNWYFDF